MRMRRKQSNQLKENQGREDDMNTTVCSQAAFLSKAAGPGDRICEMQRMIMSGLSTEHPTGTDLQEQEDMSGNR